MRLERHIGGMGKARQVSYLQARGWAESAKGWSCERLLAENERLSRALHHQLTEDLCHALSPHGWKVVDYSPRGYAQLLDPNTGERCPLPKALRRQARRENKKVADLTYALFLGALL
ncbi:MAG: hypothetical protein IPJ65_20130 [Archangiaceae bacterium]|nr:hypothetical protein [Archangiaceae bacterium]